VISAEEEEPLELGCRAGSEVAAADAPAVAFSKACFCCSERNLAECMESGSQKVMKHPSMMAGRPAPLTHEGFDTH
jgi:hypothetical protein